MKKNFGSLFMKSMVLLLFLFCISHAFAAPCGDVNSSGVIDILDALMTAQYYVGLNPPNFDAGAADVNGDGGITILDALQIAQYYVGLLTSFAGCPTITPTPTSVSTPTPGGQPTTYELQAETAATWDDAAVESDHTGFTGTGYVNTANSAGRWIQWTVNASELSGAVCIFRYAHESGDRPMELSVNGTVVQTLSFPATGAWTTWGTQTATVALTSGANAIRLITTSSSGAGNIDKMDITITVGGIVTPTPSPVPTPTPTPTNTPPSWTQPPIIQNQKPRIIATTDGEVDDRSTFVRFLMYSTDFDVQGIIQVNSRYQKSGHSRDKWIEKAIGYYNEVLPNLRKHNPDYPSGSDFLNVMRVGNENSADLYVAPPDMATKNTAGEQFIINALLDNDPRPIHIPSWGGANTTASALWRLKTQYSKADYDKAVSKIRIYCIWYQDGGGQWIEDNIPGAYIFEAFGWDNTWDYQSTSKDNPPAERAIMSSSWLNTNVKTNHGPLGAYTPQSYTSEGDTPSFLNLINNGLRAYEDYTLGGWGGRGLHTISSKPNYLTDGTIQEDGIKKKHYWRWIIDCQTDFQARMDWCVQPFSGANHQPVVTVQGSYTNVAGGLGRTVSPGATVNLDAIGSDPDGNTLSYLWWQYYQKDSVNAEISISNSTSKNASFTVPNESGKQIEIILEVKDNGSPNLKRYQRLIFNIN